MKKHEKKYIEVEGIMRACYDSFLKTGNKAYSEIISLAEAVPAADVQEVRHAKWEYKQAYKGANFGFCVCSACGKAQWTPDAKYCPNCGAKMDEVEE